MSSTNNVSHFGRRPTQKGRFLLSFRNHIDGQNILFWCCVAIIGGLVLYPLATLLKHSLLLDGEWSLAGYGHVVTNPDFYYALRHTAILLVGVSTLALGFGGALAFICEKTSFHYKKQLRRAVFVAFTIPSYILAIAWIELLARGGIVHRLLQWIGLGGDYSFQPYSLGGCMIVLGIHLYPLAFFALSNAFRQSGGLLEDSARLAGASSQRIALTIVLPLVAPSFATVALLVVSRTLANFGVVAQLALPVGIEVLTTQIFGALADLNMNAVAVLSIMLILISLVIYLLTSHLLKGRRYQVLELPETAPPLFQLERKHKWVTCGVTIFFGLTLCLPIFALFIASFLKRWGLSFRWSNLTLKNYELVFGGHPLIASAFKNSLLLGMGASTFAVLIGSWVLYQHYSRPQLKSRFLLSLFQLPLAVPNMVLAICSIFAWINAPITIYGTPWILLLTYWILFSPMVIKQTRGLVAQIPVEWEAAGQTLGIPFYRRYWRLFLPRIKSGLCAGWLIGFLIALREIPISLLLYAHGSETVGVMLFTIQSNSYGLEVTSALSMVVIAIGLVVHGILERLSTS